jgi:hypothetical protein
MQLSILVAVVNNANTPRFDSEPCLSISCMFDIETCSECLAEEQ